MYLKKYLSLLTYCFISINFIQSQVQDCATAQILCSKDSLIIPQVTGPGNFDDVMTNSCFQAPEHQSHWFRFYCTKSGSFEFSIHSINYQADYDFSMWEGGCPGSPGSISVACNWFGGVVIPPFLATGVATDPMASFNEPNNLEFIPTINLQAGKIYYLIVDNITANNVGFILKMGGTAEIGNPILNYSAGIFCNQSTVDLSKIQVIGLDSVPGGIQYFTKYLDAVNDKNQLVPPTVISSGNYYVKKTTPLGCSTIQTIGVTIENPDVTIEDVATCGVIPFDLNSVIKKEGTGLDISTFKFSYFNTQTDLLNGTNEITSKSVNKSGTYWAKATSPKGCSDIVSFKVLLEKPIASLTGQLSICPGESIPLPIVYNGKWPIDITVNASGFGNIKDNLINGEPLIVHPQKTTIYTIIGIQDSLGCSADISGTYTIVVNEIPVIKSVKTDCNTSPGNPILIVECTGGDAASYSISGINGSFTGNIFTSVPLTSGNSYSFNLADKFNCGVASWSGEVDCICDPNFKVDLLVTQPKCFQSDDGSIISTITGGNLPYSFLWSSGDISKDINKLSSGKFDITVTDALNCKTKATAIIVEPAVLNLDYDFSNITCYGANDGAINVNKITGGTMPYFYFIDTVKYTTFPFTLNGLSPGTYIINVEDKNGCKLGALFQINDAPLFAVDLGPDRNILLGESVDIPVNGNINKLASIVWSSNLNLPCYNCNEIKFSPPNSGYINILAKDSAGCISTDTMLINVTTIPVQLDSDKVYIPNIFSPNGDGINDRFMPLFGESSIQEGNLKIYNRWGSLVYNEDFKSEPKGWNGTFQNKYVNTDVYVYVLQLSINNKIRLYKGDITVKR